MIIWVNGPFGAGKTTLVEELSKRLDTAITVDPELLGFVLRRMVPAAPTGDFQDLPIWRRLTVRRGSTTPDRNRLWPGLT